MAALGLEMACRTLCGLGDTNTFRDYASHEDLLKRGTPSARSFRFALFRYPDSQIFTPYSGFVYDRVYDRLTARLRLMGFLGDPCRSPRITEV
jgi:hypothetical protein